MNLTRDDVLEILKIVNAAPLGRFSLQLGDLKIELRREADGQAPEGGASAVRPAQPAAEAPPERAEPVPAPAAAAAPKAAEEANLPTIAAPVLGIFYRRPAPGAEPYVVEGSEVEEGTTVALIEVMKCFNPVTAGVRGRIRRVCAENGELVEYGQPLFVVEP